MKLHKSIIILGGCAMVGGGVLCLTSAWRSQAQAVSQPAFRFEVPPYVMSCGYKVYKDPDVMNGRFWVAKTILHNEGTGSLHDVEISCRIPGLTEWEHPERFPEVLGGQTLTHCYYPDFADDVVNKTTRDREVIDVRIRYRKTSDGDYLEEQRQLPFTLLGRNQLAYTDIPEKEIASLSDYYSNTFFDACFVTPNDPVVRYFTQRIQQRMGGSVANSGQPEEIEKFVRAVYDTVAACGVRYGGTTGLPMQSAGVNTTVQEVRLPREVITGTAGLCIELSNLFASICASEGLQPYLFFTNNHAWPAVLLPDGSYLPVESTMVGAASYEQAKQTGMKNTMAFLQGGSLSFPDAQGNTQTVTVVPMHLLDVNAVHAAGIRPIELADSPDLRQRIDTLLEQVAVAERNAPIHDPSVLVNADPQSQPQVDPTPSFAGNPLRSSLGLTVNVPQTWMVEPSPLPQVPNLEFSASDGGNLGVEVYSFQGTRQVAQAMNILSQRAAPLGLTLRYQDQGAVPGTAYHQISGSTFLNGQYALDWIGYAVPGQQGLTAVIFHTPPGELQAHSQMILNVTQTIR